MKVILGISRSGTSYLSRKIHELGNPMWCTCNNHAEDLLIHNLLISLLSKYDKDALFFDHHVSNEDKIEFKKSLKIYKSIYPNQSGFKNPRLMFFIPEIKEVYPNAELIMLCRNFYDWRMSHYTRGRKEEWDKKLANHYTFMIKLAKENNIDPLDYSEIPNYIKCNDFKEKKYQ